jgi:hypothetical protein
MAPATAPQPLPTIAPEILAYAAEHGGAEYLLPVLEMTRRLFPDAPISLAARDDPEVADLHFLAIEVPVLRDAEVDWLVAMQRRWVEEIMQLGPPDKTLLFTLSLV